jgi:hypothetical protein
MSAAAVASSGAFRTLLWKELREAIKWAVAGLLVVIVMLAFAMATQTSVMSGIVPGMGNGPFMLATIAAGIIMGLGQSIPERAGDKWAFLAHRPVTRGVLWTAKVVAGVLLYVVVTALPFAWVMWRIATPGHQPMPFDIRMSQPGIADMVAGLVYYFAALLTGMRNARWYGSRAMAIGAAIAFSAAVIAASEFWQAIIVSLVGLLIVGWASRATFIAGGQYEPQSRTGRVALALSVLAGLAVVWALGATIAGGLLLFRKSDSRDITSVDYVVTSDGRLVRATSVYHLFQGSGGPEVTDVSDLDGKPIARFTTDSARRDLIRGVVQSHNLPIVKRDLDRRSYRDIERLFVRLFPSVDFNAPIAWYYVHRPGRIVGYDVKSARQVGWIGPDGFSPGAPTGRTFTSPMLRDRGAFGTNLLAFPDAVYQFDLKNRRVVRIFGAAAGETVLAAAEAGRGFSGFGETMILQSPVLARPSRFASQADSSIRGDSSSLIIITTTTGIGFLKGDGTPLVSAPYDPRAAGYGTVSVSRAVYAPGKPIFTIYHAAGGTLPEAQWLTAPEQAEKFEPPRATPVERFTLPPLSRPTPPRIEWPEKIRGEVAQPIIVPVATALARLLKTGSATVPGRPASTWALGIAFAILFATGAFLVGRRYAFTTREQLLWATMGFFGGVLGVALMLALREWPVRELCATCKRPRVVNRERCEHCGAEFERPALDGTEVFPLLTENR